MSGDAFDAGVLLAHGLSAKLPTDGSEYGRVYQRYRTEPGFKELVDAVARGLGLSIVAVPATGIVLAGEPGMPFAFRLSDLRLSTSEQQLFGLVLLGIAALAYPTDQQLESASPPIISVSRVERFMRSAIAPLRQLDAVEDSFEAWTASAAAAYDRMPEFIPTPAQKRAAKGCTQQVIESAFGWLVNQKMAREAAGRSYGPGAYFLTDRFRVLVGDIAAASALTTLKELGSQERTDATEAVA
jgi:hypothetical protein